MKRSAQPASESCAWQNTSSHPVMSLAALYRRTNHRARNAVSVLLQDPADTKLCACPTAGLPQSFHLSLVTKAYLSGARLGTLHDSVLKGTGPSCDSHLDEAMPDRNKSRERFLKLLAAGWNKSSAFSMQDEDGNEQCLHADCRGRQERSSRMRTTSATNIMKMINM